MDGTKLIGVDIAQKKALTVYFQTDTRDLVLLVQPGALLFGIESTTQGRLVVFGGGVLLRTRGRPGRGRRGRQRWHGERGPPGRGGGGGRLPRLSGGGP